MAAVAASWQVDDIVSDQASPSELDARLRLAIKREATTEEENQQERVVRAGNLVIDTQAYSAHLSGTALNLTFKEFELLKFMAQHPGRSSPAPSCSPKCGVTIPTTAAPEPWTCTCAVCVPSSVPSTSR